MYNNPSIDNMNQENILWDFRLESEFRGQRQKGFSFVVDVLESTPRLALYHMKTNYSISTTIASQPPYEMMAKAVFEQGGHLEEDNLYQINGELKNWIKTSLLN